MWTARMTCDEARAKLWRLAAELPPRAYLLLFPTPWGLLGAFSRGWVGYVKITVTPVTGTTREDNERR